MDSLETSDLIIGSFDETVFDGIGNDSNSLIYPSAIETNEFNSIILLIVFNTIYGSIGWNVAVNGVLTERNWMEWASLKEWTWMKWSSSSVVSAAPSPSSQDGPPRFLRVQRRFIHPIVGSDVHQIQVRELPREIFERHPAIPFFNAHFNFISTFITCL